VVARPPVAARASLHTSRQGRGRRELKVGFLMQSLEQDLTLEEGSSTQTSQILRGLRSAGNRVSLLATRPRKQILYAPSLDDTTVGRLTFTATPAFRRIESITRSLQQRLRLPWFQAFDSLRFYDACTQHLRGFDVLHERNSMYGIGGALASKRLKVPYVLFVDADYLMEHDFLGIPHTPLERLVAVRTAHFNYNAADALVCVSEVTKDHLISRWNVSRDRITVIPNAVAIPELPSEGEVRAKRAELRIGDRPTAVFVGSFFRWHAVDMLVDAFRRVLQEMPDARLLLVGDGETRSSIASTVQRWGLTQQVVFTGSVGHDEVPLLLALADVAVAPYPRTSLPFWGSPMKVFEYMAAGKAIVASRAGQIGHVIEHGRTGLLVEPGDAGGTVQALVTLFKSPALRRELGGAARHTAQCHHTWDRYIERLTNVYNQAIDRVSVERR
jgi:glycosyltransferase involved in cell wall biosynthesis